MFLFHIVYVLQLEGGDLSKKIEFSNILDFNSVGEDCPGP